MIPKEPLWKEMAPYLPINFQRLDKQEQITWLKEEFGTPCEWFLFPIYKNGVEKNKIQINYEVKE